MGKNLSIIDTFLQINYLPLIQKFPTDNNPSIDSIGNSNTSDGIHFMGNISSIIMIFLVMNVVSPNNHETPSSQI